MMIFLHHRDSFLLFFSTKRRGFDNSHIFMSLFLSHEQHKTQNQAVLKTLACKTPTYIKFLQVLLKEVINKMR